MYLNLIIPILLVSQIAMAQQQYPARAIPRTLLEHADVVVRTFDINFEVWNKGEAIETEHKVITILNESGAQQTGQIAFDYSKFITIENIEAAVYDADGMLVRRLKKKDIEDVKPPEYFVNDTRYKVLQLPARAFPYTIEYTIIRHFTGLMFYPVFSPQQAPSWAVESAKFSVVMPDGLNVRCKTLHLPEGAQTGPLEWKFNNLLAFEEVPFAPVGWRTSPQILTAPTQFSFGGQDGDMQTWNAYGAYMQELMKTQHVLPAETVANLQKMVAGCPDQACKISRIYDYLQSNTRYFFVGLGIGGWQPAPATEVDHYKYGDCKGLSNYMVAMLDAVGVPAYYTIIRAGEDEQQSQFPDFPNAWFNHIIVCVPNTSDTTWLECTSQTISCGYLSDFTDNRPALMVGPNGGQLVHTPVYNETANTSLRETNIALAADGSSTLQSTDRYTGIAQDMISALKEREEALSKKYLYKVLNINNFDINNLEIDVQKKHIPVAEMKISLSIPKLGSTSGKRVFLPFNLLFQPLEIPENDAARSIPFQADSRGYTTEDHIHFQLPEGYYPEGLFEPIAITTACGSYELSITRDKEQLHIHRKLVLNSSIQPGADYPDFITFLKAIVKADKSRIVLVKGT